MQPHHLPFLQKIFSFKLYKLHLHCSWECSCGHFTGWEIGDSVQPIYRTARRFWCAETCTHMKLSLCTDAAFSQPLSEFSVPNRVERLLQPQHREPVQTLSCHLKRDLTRSRRTDRPQAFKTEEKGRQDVDLLPGCVC